MLVVRGLENYVRHVRGTREGKLPIIKETNDEMNSQSTSNPPTKAFLAKTVLALHWNYPVKLMIFETNVSQFATGYI